MSEILGVLFAALIGLTLLPGYFAYQKTSNDNVRAVATAQQQRKIYAAAQTYIEQNSTAIQASATATTPTVITVAMLQTATTDQLPVTNPYGQTWQVQVLEPAAGKLQALVMATGGDALPDKQIAKIGSLAGATGGFIPLNDSGVYPNGPANAWGSFGGWQVPMASYSGVAGGHPASLLMVVGGQVANNYLYRNAVPGQPQVNQMSTALGMQYNDINSVGTLSGQKAALSQDGIGSCCNPSAATLSLSEMTINSGRKPTIQFHSGGYHEGYMELSGSGEPARINLRNDQGEGLGLDATGRITAPSVALPGGNNLSVGNSVVYGDSTNTALRQSNGVYLQHADGTSAPLAQVSDIVSTNGTVYSQRDWFTFYGKDAAGNDVAAAKNVAGSMNVNDIYIRSIGKWASELSVSAFTTATQIAITPYVGYQYLGVHKICVLSRVQNAFNTTVGNSSNYVSGSYNGGWGWYATGHYPDYASATCFD